MKQENKKIIIIIGNDIRIMGNFLESVHALRNNWYKYEHIRLRSSMDLEAKCRKFKVNSEYNILYRITSVLSCINACCIKYDDIVKIINY